VVNIINNDNKSHEIIVGDNAYKSGGIVKTIAANSAANVVLDLSKNHNWYDFSVKTKDNDTFEERFAGRVETGSATKTDPVMSGLVWYAKA
jgi:phospholipase C